MNVLQVDNFPQLVKLHARYQNDLLLFFCCPNIHTENHYVLKDQTGTVLMVKKYTMESFRVEMNGSNWLQCVAVVVTVGQLQDKTEPACCGVHKLLPVY